MARIKTSALISDISGKLNGTVFQRTQGGLCMRNQSGKINSNTPANNSHKIGLSTVQVSWQSLTNSERLLWQTYSIYLNKKQKKNPTLTVNGHQLFIDINTIRYDLSPDNTLFQPYPLTTPILAPLPQPINITTIERDGLALKVNLDRAVNNTKEVIILYLSRPLLGSQMSSYIKVLLMKSPTNSGTEFECNASYFYSYGRRPNVGEWLQTKIALYSTDSQNYSSYSVQRIQVT
jgi:hypothetical protein